MNMFWLWILFGLVALGVEYFARGLVFFWAGVSALIVAALAWTNLVDSGFLQIVIFSILAIGAVLAWRHRGGIPKARPTETVAVERSDVHKGRIFTLDTAIENGKGNLKVDDVYWQLAGPDLTRGSRIRVLGSQGQTLNVKEFAE